MGVAAGPGRKKTAPGVLPCVEAWCRGCAGGGEGGRLDPRGVWAGHQGAGRMVPQQGVTGTKRSALSSGEWLNWGTCMAASLPGLRFSDPRGEDRLMSPVWAETGAGGRPAAGSRAGCPILSSASSSPRLHGGFCMAPWGSGSVPILQCPHPAVSPSRSAPSLAGRWPPSGRGAHQEAALISGANTFSTQPHE